MLFIGGVGSFAPYIYGIEPFSFSADTKVLEQYRDIFDLFAKQATFDLFFIFIIVIFLFLSSWRFFLNKEQLISQRKKDISKYTKIENKIKNKLSNKNVQLIFDNKTSNIYSLKLFRKNYIFFGNQHIIQSSKSSFIFEHEVFHGYSYDTILRVILISCWPAFNITILLAIFYYSIILILPMYLDINNGKNLYLTIFLHIIIFFQNSLTYYYLYIFFLFEKKLLLLFFIIKNIQLIIMPF